MIILPRNEKAQDPISEITSDSQHHVVLDWSVGFCFLELQSTAPPTAMISPASPMRARSCFPCTPEIPVEACQFLCERWLLGFVDHYQWIFIILILTLIARTRTILHLTRSTTTSEISSFGITGGCCQWSVDCGCRSDWYQHYLCLWLLRLQDVRIGVLIRNRIRCCESLVPRYISRPMTLSCNLDIHIKPE